MASWMLRQTIGMLTFRPRSRYGGTLSQRCKGLLLKASAKSHRAVQLTEFFVTLAVAVMERTVWQRCRQEELLCSACILLNSHMKMHQQGKKTVEAC